MYKDTYQSFINLLVKCELRKEPTCDRKCDLQPSMETSTNLKMNKIDAEYNTKMNELFVDTDDKIKDVVEKEPYICATEIIETFKQNAKLRGCQLGKEFCTFRLLWLSTLAGLKDCEPPRCLIEEMDVADTKFLIRKMKDLVVSIEDVKKDKTCFQSNAKCIEAIDDIISDEFTSNDYKKQLNQLNIAADGVIGELNKKYSKWVQSDTVNVECVDRIEKCLGKM